MKASWSCGCGKSDVLELAASSLFSLSRDQKVAAEWMIEEIHRRLSPDCRLRPKIRWSPIWLCICKDTGRVVAGFGTDGEIPGVCRICGGTGNPTNLGEQIYGKCNLVELEMPAS